MTIDQLEEVKEAQAELRKAENKLAGLQSKVAHLPDKIEEKREELAEAKATHEVEGGNAEAVKEKERELENLRGKEEELKDEHATAQRVKEKREQKVEEAIQSAMQRVREEVRPEAREAIETALEKWGELQDALEDVRALDKEYSQLDRSAADSNKHRPRVLVSEFYDVRQALPSEGHDGIAKLRRAGQMISAEG